MSTYLELCNDVNRIIGLQGVISSVTEPKGIQKNIVDAVQSSWVDIQTLREDWEFMNSEISSFNTVEDQSKYTPAQVFGSTVAAENLSTYQDKKGFFLDNYALGNVPWEDLPFVPNTQPSLPTWYSIDPSTNNLHFQLPDGAYNIIIRYKKIPQVLTNASDTPFIPVQYQHAIVYKAVEKVSAYLGNSALYTQYSMEGNRVIGQMMRQYIRARRVYPRNFII